MEVFRYFFRLSRPLEFDIFDLVVNCLWIIFLGIMLGMIFLLIKRTIERERMIKKLVMNNGFNFENVEDFLTFFGCKTESGKIWTSKPKNITLKPYSGEINL
jgi:hypothetical protein